MRNHLTGTTINPVNIAQLVQLIPGMHNELLV